MVVCNVENYSIFSVVNLEMYTIAPAQAVVALWEPIAYCSSLLSKHIDHPCILLALDPWLPHGWLVSPPTDPLHYWIGLLDYGFMRSCELRSHRSGEITIASSNG